MATDALYVVLDPFLVVSARAKANAKRRDCLECKVVSLSLVLSLLDKARGGLTVAKELHELHCVV